ncbi:hypothetical protein [Alloactinosynnema sp. L-07]|uniref:hypothetical protein n=1 Tax=Alloactinosynnema sp. L-07 TaxID=1653480 RepID=UPI00065F01BF|nr:hypothetical protein [Alloactinosynnema sp. L-07]CRK55461.1 hypothetical protein [Alloactinosynnema sp. L-07]
MPENVLSTHVPTDATSTSDAVALDAIAEQIALLRKTGEKIAKFTKIQSELQRAVKARLGAVEVGTIDGRPVVTWKTTLRVAVSQKILKERYPDLVGEVSDITEVRTFKVLDQ